MRHLTTTLIGKSVRSAMALRGGGSALPGLVIEKIDPQFVRRTLADLPYGVVLVTGTNGKTTTTKMVVELLESQGLTVFTNRTGSNFTRGVAAALLGEVDSKGRLMADIAVLELDEAYAVHFVRAVPPSYALLLNVLRDQLDRFGEIDATAKLLHTVAKNTTKGVVINRDDPRLAAVSFTADITAPVSWYQVAPALRAQFPSDDDMRGASGKSPKAAASGDSTTLVRAENSRASLEFDGKTHDLSLKLKGIYNIQNATGAVALTRLVMGAALDTPTMLAALAEVEPAFGRGESLTIGGQPCELVLVKNPSGFRLSLKSFNPEGTATMIAVNDQYADGRDMSWLWDVEFDSLRPAGVAMMSGVRCYDMALRLQYDEVDMAAVEPNLPAALDTFIATHPDTPKRIYCTYTAMLAIRRHLRKHTAVETVR